MTSNKVNIQTPKKYKTASKKQIESRYHTVLAKKASMSGEPAIEYMDSPITKLKVKEFKSVMKDRHLSRLIPHVPVRTKQFSTTLK